jgi:hypothetical protein
VCKLGCYPDATLGSRVAACGVRTRRKGDASDAESGNHTIIRVQAVNRITDILIAVDHVNGDSDWPLAAKQFEPDLIAGVPSVKAGGEL